MRLKEAQAAVDAWISQFEEGYWPPLTNLARLTEEVGELARLMNHRFGHKPKKSDEAEQDRGNRPRIVERTIKTDHHDRDGRDTQQGEDVG